MSLLANSRFHFPLALLAAVVVSASACTASASQPAVSDAWARPATGTGATSAAYMTINNQTGKDDALLSVSTPAAAKAELHESMNVGGMMSMKPVERIDVPSGQSVQLKPGGYHVMLMDLTAPIDVGATVDLTLTFANGAKVIVKAPIRQP